MAGSGSHKRIEGDALDSGSGIAGVYVAWHPWLDHVYGPRKLFKIGYSDNLAGRLTDSCYVTCFSDEWEFLATFEVRRTEDARLLERSVLHACASRSVPTRELINASPDELLDVIKKVATKLGMTFRFRLRPKYLSSSAKEAESPLKLLFGVKSFTTSKREVLDWALVSLKLDGLQLPPLGKSDGKSATSETGAASDSTEMSAILRGISHAADKLAAESTGLATDKLAAVPSPTSEGGVGEEDNEDTIAAKVIKIASELEEVLPTGPDMIEDVAGDDESDVAEAIERVSGVMLDPHAIPKPIDLRDYQQAAVRQCMDELAASRRTILIMACRCGKTPVAYEIIMRHLNGGAGGNVAKDPVGCFLVPGLPLLRQTSMKIASYGASCKLLLVGSDVRPVLLPGGLSITMTTDPDKIMRFLNEEKGPRLVLSTYQSSHLLPSDAFAITVFDECHRVCGGIEPSSFNHMLLAPQHGNRLFMTATPVYHGPVNMKAKELFGQISFRYTLRQGINEGFVNPYKLRIVAGPSSCVDFSDHIITSMKMVDQMLVFCNSVDDCEALVAKLNSATLPNDVQPFSAVTVHSRMKTGSVAQVILMTATTKRLVVVNCRLFQEGVEIPTLNAVFFAAPRVSPREIVQSMCRPLTKLDHKPPSYVFLPILHDKTQSTYTVPNLQRYAAIVPFAEALLAEDSRVYDAVCDPTHAQDFRVVGTKTLRMSNDQLEMFVMPNIWRVMSHTRTMRKKLLLPKHIPWEKGMRELRRIVESCNRYPRSSDAWIVGTEEVNIAAFHRLCVKGYLDDTLEVYKRKELDALPGWQPFGVGGPFPWTICIGYLREYLTKHNGAPPPVDARCAYTGLEATPLERIAGLFLHIQLMDTRTALRMPLGKQRDLDCLCNPFGIKWRKPRDPQSNLAIAAGDNDSTLLALSAVAFQAALASDKRAAFLDEHYPGYPQKHAACESIDVINSGSSPMRKKKKSIGERLQDLQFSRTMDIDDKPVYHCKLCSVTILGENNWATHSGGKSHRLLVQKLLTGMEEARARRKAVAYEQSSREVADSGLPSGSAAEKLSQQMASETSAVSEEAGGDEVDEDDEDAVADVGEKGATSDAGEDTSAATSTVSSASAVAGGVEPTGEAAPSQPSETVSTAAKSISEASIFITLPDGLVGCSVCGTTFHATFLSVHEASALHRQALSSGGVAGGAVGSFVVGQQQQHDEFIRHLGGDKFACSLCDVKDINKNSIGPHIASKSHTKAIARRQLIKQIFSPENHEQAKFFSQTGPPGTSEQLHCLCCEQTLQVNQYMQHTKGANHLKMVEMANTTFENVVGRAERHIFERVSAESSGGGEVVSRSQSPFVHVRCIACNKVMRAWEVLAHKTEPTHVIRISSVQPQKSGEGAPTSASGDSVLSRDGEDTLPPGTMSSSPAKAFSLPFVEAVPGSTNSTCTLCKSVMATQADVLSHLKSKAHIRQVKIHETMLGLNDEQRELLEVLEDQSLRCKCCEMSFQPESAPSHFAGKAHEKNLTRMIFSGTSPAELCARADETVIVV